MRFRIFGLAFLALLLAGCAHEDQAGPDDRYLAGTLTEDFDGGDREDLDRRATQRGGELSLMESFPQQFDIRPLTVSECDHLALELSQVDYVAEVGECRALA